MLGASAFAIDNIKVSGDAKLFYNTSNADYTVTNSAVLNEKASGLFDQGASAADTALRLAVTGDLTKGVSFGATAYAVSTLGLENNLVSNTWTGAHSANNGVNDAAWMGELWIAATAGKTTAKLGRMELDTPLAFSEKWSIVPNTFDAAVVINQDLPDTTLVGAFVGKGNGFNAGNRSLFGYDNNASVGFDGMGKNAEFGTFADKGAYAVAAINNSFKPLVAQAWYYNVVNVADAYWLQADWDCQLVKDVKVGVQYANLDPKGAINTAKDSSGYAVKLAYTGVENLKLSAAYSSTDKDGTLKIANVATDNLGLLVAAGHYAAQSKLYTEANWNYGYVGAAGADSYMVLAEYNAGIAKFAAQYTDVTAKARNVVTSTDMTEVALTASKSFGPLDATLAYISTDADDQNIKAGETTGSRYDTLQAYLTLNF
ncbi:MAG: hypothetical protein Q8M39_10915 [Sulfuricurvum sp.]|nr:hypothetical protein [Sulfuricurvum sp.]